MTTIFKLRSCSPEREARSRVLAIEPDAPRASALCRAFDSYVAAELSIVGSSTEALASIAQRIPDLVLTSAFLPPRDEAAITGRLKELPGTQHLQIVTTPYFIEHEDPSAARNVLRFWNRRRSLVDPFCDLETVGRQIEEYLAQARVMRTTDGAAKQEIPRRPVVVPIRRRSEAAPAVQEIEVLNDSQGVLLETTTKIPSGRPLDLRLLGDGTDVCLSARTTRSEVAAVDALGVRYRVAAVFSRELEIPGIESSVAPEAVTPGALSDLLSRVLREIESGAPASSARRTFERGLCRLLTADDVQVRLSPIVPSKGSESFYFNVPTKGIPQPILQAVFASDAGPSAAEFKVLRAAANLAAVLLEFAPLDELEARRLNG